MNPVFHKRRKWENEHEAMRSGWYFWDETWSVPCGPFPTKEICSYECSKYARTLEVGRNAGWIESVMEFHIKYQHMLREIPGIPDKKTEGLRQHLVHEESLELLEAMIMRDLPAIAKECADMIYVVVGTALSYGIPLDQVFEIVHENNMKKPKRKDSKGKTSKPPQWSKPNIAGLLRKHGWK